MSFSAETDTKKSRGLNRKFWCVMCEVLNEWVCDWC